MKPTRYLFFFILQILWLSAISQKQHIMFDHLGTDQGLSQSNVTCILQDSRGFMWFGTQDGLNKYDGYKITVYKKNAQKTHSLSNNFVQDIVEDQYGNLWIATWGGGLNRFDRATEQFTQFKHKPENVNSVSDDFLLHLLFDTQNNLWISSSGGLDMFDLKKNTFTHYTHRQNDINSLSQNITTAIIEDSQQILWIGTDSEGLNLFDKKKKTFTRFRHDEKDAKSISHNYIWTIFEDSKHNIWIGTNGGGLNLFDRRTGTFKVFKKNPAKNNSLCDNVVFSIAEDADGNLWIGTENGGLSKFNPATETFKNYLHDELDNNSLSSSSINEIYKDRKGNMWIGTFNAGVNLVGRDARKFIHFKHTPSQNSLSNNNVLSIYEDKKDNLWIATDGGGLNLFDRKTGSFSQFNHKEGNPNSICGNYVLSVIEDSYENLWIGTWGNGLTVYDKRKNTYKHYKNNPSDPSSLIGNHAWVIYEDRDKNIWVGAQGRGLSLFDRNTNSFSHYLAKPGELNNNNIMALHEDGEGYLWIGTDGGGLTRFNKKTKTFSYFIHDDTKNSISDNSVHTITEDSQGNLWMGTNEGLNCLNKKTNQFTSYFVKDGLPNDVTYGILEDKKGNLWISTNKGISCLTPATKTFKNFGVVDGLQSNEFKQSFCKSRSGALYFGGINGFNEFFPDSLQETKYEPSLVLTDFLIFNKEVSIATDARDSSPLKQSITESSSITLPYDNPIISFEFATLNYTSPAKKQYAYMLEGFDKSWNYIGTKRSATYTNLDPGNYTLKVKGLNNQGEWSSKILTLHLTITPPFWLSWWFKTIAILFIIGCFVAFYRIRVKTITKQKAILEKQVKERTNEVVLQKEELSRNVQELDILKESLEKEKYFLDSLMDNMPDSIYYKDRESKLIRVSKYMSDHFGIPINDLIGKSDFDFQDEVHAREAYQDEQNILNTGKPKIEYIEKEVLKDGSEHWVSTTKMPLINARGEVVGTFGMSRDVTKVKILEQERHEAILEKAVAQGKFEIASDVMHDIGNAVVGFGSYLTRIRRLQEQDKMENLQSLARFFEEHKTAITAVIGEAKASAIVKMLCGIALTQRSNQEEISKSITEQLNIITHIQEILNIQRQYITGHESQERKPINLRNIINDSLSMVFASIDKMEIAVSLNMPADLPIIKGDRTKLMQAILNILKNSIEAIDVNAIEKNISLSTVTNNGRLVLQVKDSGKGFDKQTAGQLFTKGFTTKSSGSGLGLYNCRSIIESHEGTIDVISEGHGKGTLITIGFKI